MSVFPPQAVEFDPVTTDDDDELITDAECAYYKSGDRGNFADGTQEGIFSDDTGFYSAAETDGGEEIDTAEQVVDEEDEDDTRRLEYEVKGNYKAYLAKYLKSDMVVDLFSVNWKELCCVLKLSATCAGFVVTARLLDIALQIFAKQISHLESSVKKLVEDLNRLHKGKQRGKEKNPSEQIPDNPTSSRKDVSQQFSDVEAEEHVQFGLSRRNLRSGERKNKFIAANNEQLQNDFVRERSANIVARRMRLHSHFRQSINNMYLDYQFSMAEYYEDVGETETSQFAQSTSDLTQSTFKIFSLSKRLTDIEEMKQLYFLPWNLEDVEEVDTMDIGITNSMTVPSGSEGDMVGNNENLEPEPDANFLQENGNNLATYEDHSTNNAEFQQNENTFTKRKEKRKHRKRRIPLTEKQNYLIESKRPRTEEDSAVGVGEGGYLADTDGTLRSPAENLQGVVDASASETNDGLLRRTNSGLPIITDINSVTIGLVDDEVHEVNTDTDQVVEERAGSFRPPSPLYQPATEFQIRTSRVNMSAIKSKFTEIVQESQRESNVEEVTFIDILKKSGMDILVGSDETIPSSSIDSSTSSDIGSCSEVSIGVAFLAMLHNASNERFFLKEDDEFGFKISKTRPC